MERHKYNKEHADKLVEEFCDNTKLDIYSNSRKAENVYLRVLLYKILSVSNGMNDRMISEYFADYGIKRNRASIFVGLNKIGQYYNHYKHFKEVYDSYFSDGSRYDTSKACKPNGDALDKLIFSLPKHRRKEVYDLVSLRIKSWSWKTKDECKIITCSESIGHLMD